MSRKYDLRKNKDLGSLLSRLKDRLDVEQVVDSFGMSEQFVQKDGDVNGTVQQELVELHI